ncbi:hypothetical protein C8Q70DRAFT_927520 [Cubamyces menziesii]|nr:hypothetical protein C8Q70DRAFT_927520 [Cubamyces menziesii]
MGQRHQIYLIARVRSRNGQSSYRCVGAYHHQSCYGIYPLQAMARFLNLIARDENAAVIREELLELDGKYGHPWKDNNIPEVPCPYSLFLVSIAWQTDLEKMDYNYLRPRPSELDVKAGLWDTQNDDGFSIIDITDPQTPAYCFVSGPGPYFVPPQTKPIPAHRYLADYHALHRIPPFDPGHPEAAQART